MVCLHEYHEFGPCPNLREAHYFSPNNLIDTDYLGLPTQMGLLGIKPT